MRVAKAEVQVPSVPLERELDIARTMVAVMKDSLGLVKTFFP